MELTVMAAISYLQKLPPDQQILISQQGTPFVRIGSIRKTAVSTIQMLERIEHPCRAIIQTATAHTRGAGDITIVRLRLLNGQR